jgi:phosphoribosylamine-glycine ligase
MSNSYTSHNPIQCGTKLESEKTSGGRVFAVSVIANTLGNAVERAYEGFRAIHFQNMNYRTDIAKRLDQDSLPLQARC